MLSYLSPDELPDAEQKAPAPLVDRQAARSERIAAKLNDDNLTRQKENKSE